MAVQCPKVNAFISIADCEQCSFFQCYSKRGGIIFRTNCNFPESIEMEKEITLSAIDPDVS